jgi:tetratricopeptide (TPR) repeat protein
MNAKLAAILLLAGAFGTLAARPVRSEECPTVSRSEQFHHFVGYKVLTDAAESNLLRSAGDGADSRSKQQEPIGDLRRRNEQLLAGIQHSSPFRLPGLTYFAVMDHKLRSSDDEVVGVSRNMLWCLVHDGDVVLLMDHNTPHYSDVYRVDRAAKRIFLADAWPERMFVLEGRNTLGVRGQLDYPDLHQVYRDVLRFDFPGFDRRTTDAFHQKLANAALVGVLGGAGPRVVSITQSEFHLVAAGVVTLDSLDGIQAGISPMIDGRARANALMAAARVALRQPQPLYQAGADIAARALNAALATQDASLAARARGLQFLAWTLDRYAAVEAGNARRVNTLAASIKALTRNTPLATLIGTWTPRDTSRVGSIADRTGDQTNAIFYFSEAILRDSSFEEAWLGRATAKAKRADAEGAYSDATRALLLNEAAAKIVEERKTRRDPKDTDGMRFDDWALASLTDNRLAARKIRMSASIRANNCAQIQIDAAELMPAGVADAFAALANCESLAGRAKSAKQMYEQAIKLESNEKTRATYTAKLSAISESALATQ